MADTVTIKSGTPEAVAFELYLVTHGGLNIPQGADRVSALLAHYARCLQAVRNPAGAH